MYMSQYDRYSAGGVSVLAVSSNKEMRSYFTCIDFMGLCERRLSIMFIYMIISLYFGWGGLGLLILFGVFGVINGVK